jgi:hypothetical protein
VSSTNRGGQRSEADSYPTPPWPVHRLLEKLPLPGGKWLEPGGGTGNIVRAVNEMRSDVTWWSCELREECRNDLVSAVGDPERVVIGDYLDPAFEFPGNPRFDVALGNPPFWLAMEFIEKSFTMADAVGMLLRLNFIGSEERHAWMQQWPADIYVLPNRPQFRGTGSDSIEYAWFVWEQGKKPRMYGLHRMLDLTPLAVRQATRPPRLAPVPKKKYKGKLIEPVVPPLPAVDAHAQEHTEDPT